MKPLASPTLGPEWRVTRYDEAGIVIEKVSSALRKGFARLLVALGALAGASFLITLTSGDLAFVTWPVAALLLVVVLLAVPAISRDVVQARRGVRLSFSRGEVRGPPIAAGLFYDLRATEVSCAPAEVKEVLLRRVPHPPLTLSMLEVVLADGRKLQGPEVSFGPEATDPLEAFASSVGEFLSRPVRVEP